MTAMRFTDPNLNINMDKEHLSKGEIPFLDSIMIDYVVRGTENTNLGP